MNLSNSVLYTHIPPHVPHFLGVPPLRYKSCLPICISNPGLGSRHVLLPPLRNPPNGAAVGAQGQDIYLIYIEKKFLRGSIKAGILKLGIIPYSNKGDRCPIRRLPSWSCSTTRTRVYGPRLLYHPLEAHHQRRM